MGLGLPELIGHAADAASAPAGFGRARACILIHLFGGPSQIDILDLKPDAPEQFRGESRPMPTTTPGLDLCEHLPRLARRSEDFCLIRLMRHEHPRHGWGLYYMLTRRKHPRPDLDALPRLTTFRGRGPWSTGWRRGPSAVTLPGWNRFNDLPNTYSGERAGFLGSAFDPWLVRPTLPGGLDFEPDAISLRRGCPLGGCRETPAPVRARSPSRQAGRGGRGA